MRRRRPLPPLALDAALIGILLALHVGLHALWQSPLGIDLRPAPDAMEHIAVAESLLTHGIPAIEMGDGSLLPSRYEIGYPVVVAAWRAITGGGQTTALSLNLALSGLCVALVYLLGRALGGRLAGALAGLFTVLCPRMLVNPELIMSEPLAMCLALAASLLALRQAARRRPASAVGLGFAMGALCAVRLTHLLLFVHFIPAALGGRRKRRLRMFLWGLLGLLPWVVALAALHAWLNGGVLVQGYDLWAPYAVDIGTGWHWSHMVLHPPLTDPAMHGWIHAPHALTHLPMLLGLPAKGVPPLLLYPWPLTVGMILFVAAPRRPIRRRWAWTVIVAALVSLLVWGMYYFWAPRFFLPLTPLLIALGCAGLVRPLRRPGLGRFLCGALLAIGLVQQTWSVKWFLDHPEPMAMSERLALRSLSAEIPDDAVIVFDTFLILARDELGRPDRTLLNWAIDGRDLLLSESRIYEVPPLRGGSGRPVALFHGGVIIDEALSLIESARAEERPVWFILESGHVERGIYSDRLASLGLSPTPHSTDDPVFSTWRMPAPSEQPSPAESSAAP